MYSKTQRRLSFTVALGLITCLGMPLHAQRPAVRAIINPEGLSVREILERFAADKSTPPRVSEHERTILAMLWQDQDRYPAAQVDSLLDDLERLAIESPSANVQLAATQYFARAGFPQAREPRKDIARRLYRIYRSSSDKGMQENILLLLPRLAALEESLRILREIALQPPSERAYPEASGAAAGALVLMGEEGQAVVRDIYRRNLIRDPLTRRILEYYAARDFRPPVSPN
jgi:hypothetical protein